MPKMRPVVLLGPQRLRPTLVQAVAESGVSGPIAAVTAGWQEREDEIDELSAHLARPVFNLRLHHRGEDALARDPELLLAWGDLLDRRRKLQDLYRMRLGHAKFAARALWSSTMDPDLVAPELEEAIQALRDLDAQHVARTRGIWDAFLAEWRPGERDAIVDHRAEIAGLLARCEGLALAGGHVQALHDRLLLFGVPEMSGHLPVFAWSAGAMIASERVVLFHDDPPQGAGNAEVLCPGLGLVPDVVPFPHARRRLRLTDAARVGLLARRFSPARCYAMDEGARLDWDPARGLTERQAFELLADGFVAERLAP
jgi:hypothetical protein